MSQNNQPLQPPKGKPAATNLAAFSVGGQVGCATLVIVILSLFLGIGLDKLLGTKPLFTIIFVLGSAPLSLVLTYWLAMRAVKNINPQGPETRQVQPVEEEDKRE